MNKLSIEKRTQIVAMLVKGGSINSACRVTGASKNTVLKLLTEVGEACALHQDRFMAGLTCKKIQCDEIWSFVGMKEKNVPEEMKGVFVYGDVYTWTAIDADTKLIPCWHVDTRGAESAHLFINDLASRLANPIQLTTDGHKMYINAVENAFGGDIDYVMLVKQYGNEGALVETVRMNMRRLTRLTNAFSKKLENYMAAISLHFMHYNFCQIHKTLRVTPAMEAGLTDHVWGLEEVLMMVETARKNVVPKDASN